MALQIQIPKNYRPRKTFERVWAATEGLELGGPSERASWLSQRARELQRSSEVQQKHQAESVGWDPKEATQVAPRRKASHMTSSSASVIIKGGTNRTTVDKRNKSVYRCVGMKPATLPCTTEYTQTLQIKVGESRWFQLRHENSHLSKRNPSVPRPTDTVDAHTLAGLESIRLVSSRSAPKSLRQFDKGILARGNSD
jgi:hypothetical protein